MQIIKATENDLPQLVQLVNSAYRGESSKQGWTTEAALLGGVRTTESNLLKEMNEPGVSILKLENEQQELLACVFLQVLESKLYLGMLTVRPDLQNKGLGKILLQHAEQFANSLKLPVIEMTVISERTELIDWYKRHGYTPTGKTKPFVEGVHIGNPVKPIEFLVLTKMV
jgi:ribosomal protein S18 acetylase RimI-like enzyme